MMLPAPGFEGFEKRLEVEFSPASAACSPRGLRNMPRAKIDELLTLAECTIVSQLSNELFDSYVLSESSLFIHPFKLVIKTCGTTALLKAVPTLLKHAAELDLKEHRVKYTRGTFNFPAVQPYPHGSFAQEIEFLEQHFGHLGAGGKAYVLGAPDQFPNWHVYEAASSGNQAGAEPTFTLEMCMQKLDSTKAAQFFKAAGFADAKAMTVASGIDTILPGSEIDAFDFEPCGYSMNGIENRAFSTIHITPEDAFSYASFEASGYAPQEQSPHEMVQKVLGVFNPGRFSLALSADGKVGAAGAGAWGVSPAFAGYVCDGTIRQEMAFGAALVFHTFKAVGSAPAEVEVCVPEPLFADREVEKLYALAAKKRAAFAKEKLQKLHGGSGDLWEALAPLGDEVATAVASFKPTLASVGSPRDVDKYAQNFIKQNGQEAPFMMFDLGMVARLYDAWTTTMPRVEPFYAVKCNGDPALLAVLAALGANFDCASLAEMQAVAAAGVGPERIIYANPCKLESHLRHAVSTGVKLTVFDAEDELYKIKKVHPGAELLLRIRADDVGAQCPLGSKYGAEFDECEPLLRVAKRLGLSCVGVSFHVGSGAASAQSFVEAIKAAKLVFEMAEGLGMPKMKVLDIGGGLSVGGKLTFSAAGAAINKALEKFFPEEEGVKVIAEPGRYFAEAPATLAALVFGRRLRGLRHAHTKANEYYINDGVYGSMNCLLYDHATISARPLRVSGGLRLLDEKMYRSTVFGPTCDGLDQVLTDVWLPKLEVGDWLLFPNMGAYTLAAGTSFNGFATSDIKTHYLWSEGDRLPFGEEEPGSDSDSHFGDAAMDSSDTGSDGGEFQSEGEAAKEESDETASLSGSDDDAYY
ncbi:Ornithine decarboxylase-like protein [Klebsormidium nitens]|uniref:Ornithine decarboxylase-like protein n=1 Tax=Klebsormidium nitens TaxID=105231 RepID=A0A1Y1HLG4_KLENI|nr:Ornithine decarboxylase-like protein [Klebsormidium nitens]|eukprot:GAQ79455.1 Ornithine decarboxylase-like protein [Klebsormidium nitens]